MIKNYVDIKNQIVEICKMPYELTGNDTYGENIEFKVIINREFEDEVYCPNVQCNDYRMMNIKVVYSPNLEEIRIKYNKGIAHGGFKLNELDIDTLNNTYLQQMSKEVDNALNGTLIKMTCLQCKATMWLILFKSINGMDSMFLSENSYSIATPHTPEAVKYYLDQAYKAKSLGANSAAVTMYRAALEQLMYDKGFTKDENIGAKLNRLNKQIESGNAPKWMVNLDSDILTIIKELGNGAIHPNNGDIQKQILLDNELVEVLDIMFSKVLYEAYEREIEEGKGMDILRRAVQKLRKHSL